MLKSQYESAKKEVLDASLWLSEQGFFGSQRGSGGNISVRLNNQAMAITPSSVKYQELTTDDICVVGFDGTPIDIKDGLKPSVEVGLHGLVYQKRTDAQAVVHTHQIYGSIFSVLNMPIPALFDEVSFSLGAVVEVAPYALSGSQELAANVSNLLSNNANACIIQNHGILTLGKNLDKAILHAELLEKIAQIYCMALSTGRSITTLPTSVTELATLLRNSDVEAAGKG